MAGNHLPRQRQLIIARVAIGTDQLGDPGQPRRAQIRLGGFQAGPCALPLAPPNRLNTKPAPRLEALTFCTAAPAVEPRLRDASAEPDAWAARTPVPRRSAAAARMRSRAAASSRFCFSPARDQLVQHRIAIFGPEGPAGQRAGGCGLAFGEDRGQGDRGAVVGIGSDGRAARRQKQQRRARKREGEITSWLSFR
ncbi:hypothetical protein [Paracoccus versutus]